MDRRRRAGPRHRHRGGGAGRSTGTSMLWLLNHLYIIAQLGVIPGVLIFLYRRSRGSTTTLRNTILATWLLSVPVYGLFPVAPPRLADIGIVDTITPQTGSRWTRASRPRFYNQLAAVPSLHVGFAVAVGFALAAAVRNPVAQFARAAWGPVDRPRGGRHRQPLRVRHRRRRRRQRAPATASGASAGRGSAQAAERAGARPGLRRGLSRRSPAPARCRRWSAPCSCRRRRPRRSRRDGAAGDGPEGRGEQRDARADRRG